MAKAIKPDQLGKALAEQLTIYHEDVTEQLNACSKEATEALVKETKATAPERTGRFKKSIASKLLKKSKGGDTYVWYVKAPLHRVTHLLVHGHALPNGGRTKADPFLKNAVDKVLPDYEKKVEEVVRGG